MSTYTHRMVHISLENSYTCVSCSLMKLCLLLHISKLYLVLNKVVLSDVASCLLVWIPSLLPVWVPMYIFLYRLKYNAFIPLSTGGFFFYNTFIILNLFDAHNGNVFIADILRQKKWIKLKWFQKLMNKRLCGKCWSIKQIDLPMLLYCI